MNDPPPIHHVAKKKYQVPASARSKLIVRGLKGQTICRLVTCALMQDQRELTGAVIFYLKVTGHMHADVAYRAAHGSHMLRHGILWLFL